MNNVGQCIQDIPIAYCTLTYSTVQYASSNICIHSPRLEFLFSLNLMLCCLLFTTVLVPILLTVQYSIGRITLLFL